MNEITRMALFNQVMEILKGMNDGELVGVWNEYCDRNNMYDDRVEDMELLNDLFQGESITYILNRAFLGSDQFNKDSGFNPNRDYFTFNGYGNLVSLDCIGWNEYANEFMYSGLDEIALVDYILDNMDALENEEIENIIEEYENGIE